MQLAYALLVAMVVLHFHHKTMFQQSSEKLGGMDVLLLVMEYQWHDLNFVFHWKHKVLDCLEKIFDFGTAPNQANFGVACSIYFGDKNIVGYMIKLTGKERPGDEENYCDGFNGGRNLQEVLAVGALKINQTRPNASLVTIVLSDNTLEDTILTGPAAFFAEGKNVLLNLYKIDKPPASEQIIDKMAGGRNRAKVINILDNGALCDSDDINHVKIGLCSPLRKEILNKTACAPRKDTPGNCVQLVTFNPQLQRADITCPDLLSNNLENCACPTTTTIATTAFINHAGTTAANTGIISIIVYCAAGLFVLLAIGIGICFVCRKKWQRQIAAKNAQNVRSSKVSTLTALGVWNPQISPTSTIVLESIEKINPGSILISPKIGEKVPPVAASLTGSKVGTKKSATPSATLKVKMDISQVKMYNSQSKTSKTSTYEESQPKTSQMNQSTKSKILPINAKISRV